MNFNYHIYAPSIKCPYCDKECYDDDYLVAQDLEVRVEFECEYCGKVFYAEACIVYNTYSDCALNNKEHIFKQSKSHSRVFNCENCYYTEVRDEIPLSENKR